MINQSYIDISIDGKLISKTNYKVNQCFIRWNTLYTIPSLYLEIIFTAGFSFPNTLKEGTLIAIKMGTSAENTYNYLPFLINYIKALPQNNNSVGYSIQGLYYSTYLYDGQAYSSNSSPISVIKDVVSICDLGGATVINNLNSLVSNNQFKFYKTSRVSYAYFLKNTVIPECAIDGSALPAYCHDGFNVYLADLNGIMKSFSNNFIPLLNSVIVSSHLVSNPSESNSMGYAYGANVHQYIAETGAVEQLPNAEIYIPSQPNLTKPEKFKKVIYAPLNVGNEDSKQYQYRINTIRALSLYNTVREVTVNVMTPGLTPFTPVRITQSSNSEQTGDYVLIGKTIISYYNEYYEKLFLVTASIKNAQIPVTS